MRSSLPGMIRCAGLALLIGGGALWAERLKDTVPVDMPGVDGAGAVDTLNTSDGTAKVSFSTRSGKFRFRARGMVENLSNHTQVFKNDPEVNDHFAFQFDALDATIERSKYRVKANGKAKAVARGTAEIVAPV